jgi:hypothetical protein
MKPGANEAFYQKVKMITKEGQRELARLDCENEFA